MSSAFDAAADALYALPLAQFVAERKRLAGELRATDKAGAAALLKLPRPSQSAWAVNQLFRRDAEGWARLLEVTGRLRAGQLEALGEQRAVIAELCDRAEVLLKAEGQAGSELVLRRVATDLRALAALGWGEAGAGRLADDLEEPGFNALQPGALPVAAVPVAAPAVAAPSVAAVPVAAPSVAPSGPAASATEPGHQPRANDTPPPTGATAPVSGPSVTAGASPTSSGAEVSAPPSPAEPSAPVVRVVPPQPVAKLSLVPPLPEASEAPPKSAAAAARDLARARRERLEALEQEVEAAEARQDATRAKLGEAVATVRALEQMMADAVQTKADLEARLRDDQKHLAEATLKLEAATRADR